MKPSTSPSAQSPSLFWSEVSRWSKPADFFKGLRIHEGLAPDNLIIFPFSVSEPSNPQGYGHYHPRYVLNIVQDSRLRLQLGTALYELHPNECALIFPHQFHEGTLSAIAGREGGSVVITFDLDDPEAITELRNTPRKLRKAEKEILHALLVAYRQKRSGLESAFHLARLLRSLISAPGIPTGRQGMSEEHPGRGHFLEAVHAFLKQPQSAEPLLQLAQEMGLTESELKARFQHYTSGSLAEYARRRKMALALGMLQNQEGSVAEIAEKLGFSSLQAFSRAFKTAHRLSPKQYEILLRKNRRESI